MTWQIFRWDTTLSSEIPGMKQRSDDPGVELSALGSNSAPCWCRLIFWFPKERECRPSPDESGFHPQDLLIKGQGFPDVPDGQDEMIETDDGQAWGIFRVSERDFHHRPPFGENREAFRRAGSGSPGKMSGSGTGSPNRLSMGTIPAHTGKFMSSSRSLGGPVRILADPSEIGNEKTEVARISASVGLRASSHRFGAR